MNRPTMIMLTVLLTGLLAVTANAQEFGPGQGEGQGEYQFVDEDGDGFNDLAPDFDGDGIPNGQDDDYVKAEDGTGYMHQNKVHFGDLDEEDRGGFHGGKDGEMSGNRYGPGDGTGTGVGPEDGTGFGSGSGDGSGDGTCDGTGEGDGDGDGDRIQQRGNRG
ncbi:MAG: hypothetical protein KOO60_09140 [Gemmatimonadales bacterium]|nr:hypothetical protein [Gemmatimonadales bacterium]